MKTLFDRSSLPLWVFVVIIVVGSLCILATIGFITRCVVVKRRAKKAVVEDEFSAPMRKVTVRRGRMVPQSHYLSLTGSKFGLNEFDNDASTARSRSPFEWWSKVNKKQGQEEMSQRGSIYGRKDFAQSSISLTESMHEKQPSSSVHEIEPAQPSPTALPSPRATPSPTPSPARAHFSRPFHSQNPGSPFIREPRLSMIEEATSPHTSMISTHTRHRSSKISITPSEGNLTRYEPRRASHRPSNTTSTDSTNSVPPLPSRDPSQHDVLTPLAYRGSRSSLGEMEQPRPSLSHRSSTNSRNDSVHSHHDDRQGRRSPMPSLVEQPQHQQQQHRHHHWNGGQDPKFPVRVASKKGNVLRKKSLMKMEIMSTIS